MNLLKAIEILEIRALAYRKTNFPDREDAIKLGIEALKLYMALKATSSVPRGFEGIGETSE